MSIKSEGFKYHAITIAERPPSTDQPRLTPLDLGWSSGTTL